MNDNSNNPQVGYQNNTMSSVNGTNQMSQPVVNIPNNNYVNPVMPVNVPTQEQPYVQELPVVQNVAVNQVNETNMVTKASDDVGNNIKTHKSLDEDAVSIAEGEAKTVISSADISDDLVVKSDKDTSKVEVTNKEKDNEYILETNGNRKLPVTVLIIFATILILAVIYYFIFMTPEKVFDKAINSAIDTVENVIKNAKNSEIKTAAIDITTDVSMGPKDIEYLDGLSFTGNLDVDLEKLAIAFGVDGHGKSKWVNYDANVYLKDGAVLVSSKKLADTFGKDKVALYSESNSTKIDYDRLDAAIRAFDATKERILSLIDDDELKRVITLKKIDEQTTIALKVTCDVNHELVEHIYNTIFKEYVSGSEDAKNVIKDLAKAFGTSEEKVIEKIKELLERDVVTQNIHINLYMNLANTQLISLDVTVDDYYVQIENLNGIYLCTVEYGKNVGKSNSNPNLKVEFKYDNNKGLLNGIGIIDNEDTYLRVDFDYTRKENDKGRKVGNTLNLEFYKDYDKKDMISIVNCTLDIVPNEKIDIKDKSNAISEITDTIREEMDTNMESLKHYYSFVVRRLLYNKVDDKTFVDRMEKELIEKTGATKEELKDEEDAARNICFNINERKYLYKLDGIFKSGEDSDSAIVQNCKIIFPENETGRDKIHGWACCYKEVAGASTPIKNEVTSEVISE